MRAGTRAAPMAGENAILAIDQHRVGEAEPGDGIGDLAHLLARVGAGIARRGFQLARRAHGDLTSDRNWSGNIHVHLHGN